MADHASSMSTVQQTIVMSSQSTQVVVQYVALPRESKTELEKLLREWLSWHCALFPPEVALPDSMQLHDGVMEFLPALAGNGADSALAFLDVPKRPGKRKSITPDSITFSQRYEQGGGVPRYDLSTTTPLDAKDAQTRVLQSLGRASDATKGSGTPGSSRGPARKRCWNCGSYAHELRDCWNARDEDAIAGARRALHSGRKVSMQGPRRYFTEGGSAADELAGLRPGVLSEELCTALGIAALAPPPWLARMRALGYPPGWRGETQQQEAADGALHFDDELGALPAADEDDMQLVDVLGGGKLPDQAAAAADCKELVAFPGLNAPLPEGADAAAWHAAMGDADGAQHAAKRASTDAGQSGCRLAQPALQPQWQAAQLAQQPMPTLAHPPTAAGNPASSVPLQLPPNCLSWPGAWHSQPGAAAQLFSPSAAANWSYGHQQQSLGSWPLPYQLPAYTTLPVQGNGSYQGAGSQQLGVTQQQQQQQQQYASAALAHAVQQAAAARAAAFTGAQAGHFWPMPALANGTCGQPVHGGHEEQPPLPPPLPPELPPER